jgi:hypothetical protein
MDEARSGAASEVIPDFVSASALRASAFALRATADKPADKSRIRAMLARLLIAGKRSAACDSGAHGKMLPAGREKLYWLIELYTSGS